MLWTLQDCDPDDIRAKGESVSGWYQTQRDGSQLSKVVSYICVVQ
jgi:hypothetical protein